MCAVIIPFSDLERRGNRIRKDATPDMGAGRRLDSKVKTHRRHFNGDKREKCHADNKECAFFPPLPLCIGRAFGHVL